MELPATHLLILLIVVMLSPSNSTAFVVVFKAKLCRGLITSPERMSKTTTGAALVLIFRFS